jgi:RNA polymerase sigma-70 factor, ECF subfamily
MSFLREVELEQEFGPSIVFRQALGFLPNLIRAQSLLPRVIEAQAKLEDAARLRDGELSRAQKERILLTIAADRRNTYCIAMHSRVLSSLGATPGQIDDLLNDYRRADLSALDLASLQFCLKLSRNAPAVQWEDIEALRIVGLTDQAIFEIVVVTALAIYLCTLSAGLRPELDFQARELPLPTGPPPETRRDSSSADIHRGRGRKGPYVPAPYLSPHRFAPFAILRETHGFIPNFFRSQTLRPDLLKAELEAVNSILFPEDALSRVQKECILLVVSAANLNSYCVAVHCNLLRGLGVSPEEGDQIAVDYRESGLSNADKALLGFAVKLGAHFSDFSNEDVIGLRALGFTEQKILECVVVTALNNFANIVQMGLGFELDFESPTAFEQDKVNLLAAVDPPMRVESFVQPSPTTVEDSDAGLVSQAQAGNLEAFEGLVRRHSELIYRTLIAILGNPAEAQDAMQDALLSAFKHIGGFEGRSKISTWLVSIARNAALQQLRRRKHTESLDDVDVAEDRDFRPRQVRAWQDNPEQGYSKAQVRELVERGILQLPAKYRVVVMLRDIEQLSSDEVSRQLGLSVPTVKTRLLRGRLMLREWLSPYFSSSARRAAP